MKKIFIFIIAVLSFTIYPHLIGINYLPLSYADSSVQTSINKGINYLGTQLKGATGQIMGGSTGDATPWAAIAFSVNGIDPSTVKTSTHAPSLLDYLDNNPPTTSSPATDWEKWILALKASNQNVSNFIGTFKSTYYANNQIENNPGDTTDEASDWFGVLALIAGGVDKSDKVLTTSLAFIISHQNCDGGFGYAATAGSDGNDTAAAIQALVDAKEYGITNPSLDNAISNAKAYLLATQDALTGGFLYDTNPWTTAPDSDSTTWAIMALNVLGMGNSTQANRAKTWLISSPQQSSIDGGFTACNSWDPTTYACTGVGSNSTTSSHALIGLAGKGWALNISNNSDLNLPSSQTSCAAPTPTPSSSGQTGVQSGPTVTPTPTPSGSSSSLTPTPTPTPSSSGQTGVQSGPTPTPTSVPTSTPTSIPTNTPTPTLIPISANQTIADVINTPSPTPTPTITQEVLGAQTNSSSGQIVLFFTFLGIGTLTLGAYGFKKLKGI